MRNVRCHLDDAEDLYLNGWNIPGILEVGIVLASSPRKSYAMGSSRQRALQMLRAESFHVSSMWRPVSNTVSHECFDIEN